MASFTGVTLAVDGSDRVHGYASWQRGGDVGAEARLEVADLVATRHEATRLLLRTLGSFAPVAPTTRIRTSIPDPLRYLLPTSTWRVVTGEPYMLRLLDPAAAFGLRRYPRRLEADVVFGIADEFLTDLDGSWRLSVATGPRRASGPTTPRARSSPGAGWPRRTPGARAPRTCGWPDCCPATTPTTTPGTRSSAVARCTSATTSALGWSAGSRRSAGRARPWCSWRDEPASRAPRGRASAGPGRSPGTGRSRARSPGCG